ncbi:MAG: hypothetical protein K0R54_398 [Clostridiaceae bacterium]|jgi:uncharacterized protein (DUF2164 family)|nr:hypothetical protein [Clostridiaceae bacterium]
MKNKNLIELDKETKQELISEIMAYFLKEREEEIGDLAASIMLKYITEKIGPAFYNKGIRDAIAYMNDRVDDMYGLEK